MLEPSWGLAINPVDSTTNVGASTIIITEQPFRHGTLNDYLYSLIPTRKAFKNTFVWLCTGHSGRMVLVLILVSPLQLKIG